MAMIDVPAGWTLEDVLASGATVDDPQARTAEELAAAIGHDAKWVRKRLASLLREGRAEVVYVRRTRIDGQPYQAPAYKLAPPTDGK